MLTVLKSPASKESAKDKASLKNALLQQQLQERLTSAELGGCSPLRVEYVELSGVQVRISPAPHDSARV
jgi:hypothetical protein